MFWQLTFRAALAVAVCGAVSPAIAQRSVQRPATRQPAALHSVHWERVPLGDAVARLRRTADADVVLDRRVDPNQRVTLSVDRATADDIAAQLAAACSLGTCRLGPLLYVGPKEVADRLPALAAERRRATARLPEELRRSLAARKAIGWPRLSVPRDLIVQLANEHGWRVEHAELIPYDLWPAGRLPSLPLADQLTALLAGFDLTYRPHPERSAIEIVAVDWQDIEPAATEPAPPRREKESGETRDVFTLRVAEQPVGLVLSQLAQRLGWKIVVDEAAIRAAGRSLDQRVSFTVENTDADQLLEALLKPAGLTSQRNGDRIQIQPAP